MYLKCLLCFCLGFRVLAVLFSSAMLGFGNYGLFAIVAALDKVAFARAFEADTRAFVAHVTRYFLVQTG